jgi:hypothetical protein
VVDARPWRSVAPRGTRTTARSKVAAFRGAPATHATWPRATPHRRPPLPCPAGVVSTHSSGVPHRPREIRAAHHPGGRPTRTHRARPASHPPTAPLRRAGRRGANVAVPRRRDRMRRPARRHPAGARPTRTRAPPLDPPAGRPRTGGRHFPAATNRKTNMVGGVLARVDGRQGRRRAAGRAGSVPTGWGADCGAKRASGARAGHAGGAVGAVGRIVTQAWCARGRAGPAWAWRATRSCAGVAQGSGAGWVDGRGATRCERGAVASVRGPAGAQDGLIAMAHATARLPSPCAVWQGRQGWQGGRQGWQGRQGPQREEDAAVAIPARRPAGEDAAGRDVGGVNGQRAARAGAAAGWPAGALPRSCGPSGGRAGRACVRM